MNTAWPDEGIFGESPEEEYDYEDDEEEGGIDDLTTRAEEEMVSALPGTAAPKPARQLVAVFGADGAPLVSYAVDGHPQEQFRQPTQQELALLQQRGRLVQGSIEGMGSAPAPSGSFLSRNSTLLAAVAAVGVGAGVYLYQRRKKAKESLMRDDVEFATEDFAVRGSSFFEDEED
jgi:hypothetical protein